MECVGGERSSRKNMQLLEKKPVDPHLYHELMSGRVLLWWTTNWSRVQELRNFQIFYLKVTIIGVDQSNRHGLTKKTSTSVQSD